MIAFYTETLIIERRKIYEGDSIMKCYIKDYPRPQFVRNNWENLNGTWDFAFDDQNVGEKEKWYENFAKDMRIQVPFTYETKLSGIQEESRHDNIWYHRVVNVDAERLEKDQYIIHFEGSDFITKLWVNGSYVGSHKGGYARFSFDITAFVRDGANELTVKVEDSFDMQQPRGKQRWVEESFGCWYIQTTGIWKTVWTEYVPKISLDYVKMTPDMERLCMDLEVDIKAPESCFDGNLMLETVISFQGELVNRTFTALTSYHVKASIDMHTQKPQRFQWWDVKIWSPRTPNLYDVEFRLVRGHNVIDEVGSYFAMREIRIDGTNILLNGRQLYQRLILDQGYWKDSHLTPPSEEALIDDIDKVIAMGFNGVRKHQKIEDERFLYWCDVKGVLLWSESPAFYQYTDYAGFEFATEWMEILKQNYNHPCIITWTPFNESWGMWRISTNREQQHFTEAVYHITKCFDPMRPVIVNDGWEHTISDIITLHDYEASGERFTKRYTEHKDDILNSTFYANNSDAVLAQGYAYRGQPVIISEYGGIAFSGDGTGWGYGEMMSSEEEFIKRYDAITTAVKALPYSCGFCYTQVSDIQQEINGLLDGDHNYKMNPETIKEINLRNVRK